MGWREDTKGVFVDCLAPPVGFGELVLESKARIGRFDALCHRPRGPLSLHDAPSIRALVVLRQFIVCCGFRSNVVCAVACLTEFR